MTNAVTSGTLSQSLAHYVANAANQVLAGVCVKTISIDTFSPTPAPSALPTPAPSALPTPAPSLNRPSSLSPLPSSLPSSTPTCAVDDEAREDDDDAFWAVVIGVTGLLVGLCFAGFANGANRVVGRLTKGAHRKGTAYISPQVACNDEMCDAFTQAAVDSRDAVTQTVIVDADVSRVSETSETLWAEASTLEEQRDDQGSESSLVASIVTEPGSVRYLKVLSRCILVSWATLSLFVFPSLTLLDVAVCGVCAWHSTTTRSRHCIPTLTAIHSCANRPRV